MVCDLLGTVSANGTARVCVQCEEAAKHFGVVALRDISASLLEKRGGELSPLTLRRARSLALRRANPPPLSSFPDFAGLGAGLYAYGQDLGDARIKSTSLIFVPELSII